MRSMTVTAPLLLLAYGVCRWIDGWDGDRGGGPAWNIGHVCFLLSVLLFAGLAAGLAAGLRRRAADRNGLAIGAVVAVVAGAACFVWVIIGDLSDAFRDAAPLPDPLKAIGPPLFTAGLLVLLALEVTAGRLRWWSPVLFFLGFVATSVDLDLLPPGAVLITVAVLPLLRGGVKASPGAARHSVPG